MPDSPPTDYDAKIEELVLWIMNYGDTKDTEEV